MPSLCQETIISNHKSQHMNYYEACLSPVLIANEWNYKTVSVFA